MDLKHDQTFRFAHIVNLILNDAYTYIDGGTPGRGVCDVKRKISPYILRRCVMGLEERKIRFQMCATTSAQTERVQYQF